MRALLVIALVAAASEVAARDVAALASAQNASPRVAVARRERGEEVRRLFATAKVAYPPAQLYLRIFKHERQVEVWARDAAPAMKLVTTYRACATSGDLGPKRRQGDGQIPEGFYVVDRFNPTSNFYLSLGLDYPNASDRLLGERGNLGGDIFIHGDCVTIGCVPIEDDIKALYLMALDTYVSGGGRPVVVHLFPRRLDDAGVRELLGRGAMDAGLVEFWRSLVPAYELFERERVLPRTSVDPRSGRYSVRSGR